MAQTGVQPATISKNSVWVGRIISAIPVLALLFSGSVKLMKVPSVVEGFAQFGYPASLIRVIGLLEIACPIIYLIPRTAVLGAILMTGFLGGAIVSNLRLNNPLFWVPLLLGVLAWGGLYLRDRRLRVLIPLRD